MEMEPREKYLFKEVLRPILIPLASHRLLIISRNIYLHTFAIYWATEFNSPVTDSNNTQLYFLRAWAFHPKP